jgi:hypothetical protein
MPVLYTAHTIELEGFVDPRNHRINLRTLKGVCATTQRPDENLS